MPPVPKKKHTKNQSQRKAKFPKRKLDLLTPCRSCGKLRFPHKACPHCGFYK